MAEVYWINGFEKTLADGETPASALRTWLDEIHVRLAWVDQVNMLGDLVPAETLSDLEQNELPAGFVFSGNVMDEHFFLQQVLRRMRMDESESQLVVLKMKQTCTAALFISHRQVGRYNLLPRLVVAEQMAVLQPQQLQKRLENMPEEYEQGVYLTAVQDAWLAQMDISGLENVSGITMDENNLLSCLLDINSRPELKDQFGLLLSRAEHQPVMVTSVRGC